MLSQTEQRKAAREFAKKWEGIGDEKGDSQKFWMSLLQDVYGIEHPADYIRFEDRVMLNHTSFIDGYIPSTHVLIEQKSIKNKLTGGFRQSDGSLLSAFQQAKRYSIELPYDDRPRWIVLSNFREFHIYDMNKPQGEAEILYLKDLEEDYYRLNFLVDQEDENIKKAIEVSIQAGDLVGILYDALLNQYIDKEDEKTLKDLNILCVRLVFCFYAEDAGLFGKNKMFHDYMHKFKDNPASFRDSLIRLFKVLDQKEADRDPYLSEDLLAFPYVNGGLFENEEVVIPRINEEIIDIILNKASDNFDWSNISPTIFGSVFESTLNPETRRSGGMHYTSMENIHKLIDPLFLNDLNREFEEALAIKTLNTRKRKLEALHEKIASLRFLDPAAGSGNFLTETYISLRKLENKIIKELQGRQIVMGQIHNPIKVSISQFYGIEINDFAVSVARTALWIAESQMLRQTEDIINLDIDFFPLKAYANIVEANALEIDWEDVVPKNQLNYIMGNPPFVGAAIMNKDQKQELVKIFNNLQGAKSLDYVSAWYKVATNYIRDTKIEVAFVSTNSIVQGEQPGILWKDLFSNGIIINFAYRTFAWESEATNKAQVHCVIVGFSNFNRINKTIIENSLAKKVSWINGYLLEAGNIFIGRRTKPICDVPRMTRGSSPCDNGNYSFNKEEVQEFISRNPHLKNYIRKYIGAREFINRIPRYCIWLEGITPQEIRKSPDLIARIENVVEFRKSSKKAATRERAERPTEWEGNRYIEKNSILIPRVSSENRKYVPIGFLDSQTIANDSVQIIADATIYDFGILTSNVHNGWMRAVAGRLEMRYRYSGLVYNNFPWPNPSPKQKKRIETTANMILKARKLYPEASLADLYDELTMPIELRKAHQANDAVVMEAYGFNWRTMTESECVAELMKMYQKLTAI
ncbi:MAG: methylase [Tissierellia bacterium]|nr:methylase [Tissierellia bacterium]